MRSGLASDTKIQKRVQRERQRRTKNARTGHLTPRGNQSTLALSDEMEERSDSIHGELLVETEGGRAMYHQPDELVSGGEGQPRNRFDGLIGNGGTNGVVRTRNL